MDRLQLPRALTAFIARRMIRLATIIAACILVGIIVIAALLAHFFTAWWWLLVLPFVVLFIIFLLIRMIAGFIVGKIHHTPLTKEQQKAMSTFVDKIQAILEARATPLPLIVIICLKDILFHRDLVTIKQLIGDTKSLRNDYAELEKLF